MGRAYSQDLRLRVLSAIDGGMTKMKAHQTFQVSRSTMDDWLKLREQTGGVAAKKPGGGNEPAISDLRAFEAFAARHSGCTLEQMSRAWEHETGRKLSGQTFSVMLKKIGWTRKKRALPTASATTKSENSSWSS
jgi:transposase